MKTKCLFMILLALALVLTACSDAGDETGNSSVVTGAESEQTAEPEPEPELMDAVPETLDFGGTDFIFLANEMYGAPSLVEGLTGEVFNDATYEVELYTEERLNVKISEVLEASMQTAVPQLVTSGDTTYDTYSMSDKESTTVAVQGVFHPMAEIPYVDLTQIYWGDGLSDSLSIGGSHYFAVSSFNLYSLERTALVLFNNAVANNHGIEIPYEDVFNGTWTQDILASYGDAATQDVNGDGVMDMSDSYTYGASDYRDVPEKFIFASAMNMIDVGEDDLPYLTFYGNEKFIDSLNWTRQVFFGENRCPVVDQGSIDMFVVDREMITVTEFRNMPSFREMESDFSILPLPKYDETQPRYYSRTCNVIFSMVPVTALDLDKAGAVQEVMSCAGYKTMLPAYIDSAMKNKVARNRESADAIQIIYDTRSLDLAKLYLPTFFDTKIYIPLREDSGVISMFESQRNVIEKSLQKVIDGLTK